MPPGDTLYLDTAKTVPLKQVKDPAGVISYQLFSHTKDDASDIGYFIFPVLMLGLFIIYKIYHIFFEGRFENLFLSRREKNEFEEKRLQYDNWLAAHNPYYQSLPIQLKERFLRRTVMFAGEKTFRFHGMKGEEYMKALVSGAAVQLTFGFLNYRLSYFPVINIIRKEYRIPGSDQTFEGHVTSRSINISWNNFLDDYTDYTDSQNVGLHEMAHAISFDVFHGNGENNSASLNRRFQEYVKEAAPVFKNLRRGECDTLDYYAATNVEEFWAVAVETFFETPEDFRNSTPDLYDALCELLNQDPLRPEKIVNKKLAGVAG